MINALFICSRNKLRSPTGEAVASQMEGVYADSAGLAPDAINLLDSEQVKAADIIFVMESHHKKKLTKKFSHLLKDKSIVVLGIQDNYEYMQPELVAIFEQKLPQFLEQKLKKKHRL